MAFHNNSNKPVVERECLGFGMKGHTIADCRKISTKTKKELISLGNFGMNHHLKAVKKKKTASKEGTQHVAQ